MRKGTGAVVVTMASLLLWALPVGATVLLFLDIPQLTARASQVIQGEVVRQQVIVGREHIWTDSYIRVSETFKGQATPGKLMVLRQLGGETKRRGMRVAGMARFRPGEQVLVFARPAGPGLHVPVGACLGKFSIYHGKGGPRVRRDFAGASFARHDSRGTFILEHTLNLVDAADMSYAELVHRISSHQARGGAR